MKKHYRQENDCLNCGATLQGRYCQNCGQENLQIKESFGHMMNHAISDYFHFDHQFFHTLNPLLFKPGYLTNEYMGGRRAQYLHPVKMYIFISIVFFLLFFKSGHNIVNINETHTDPVKTEKSLNSTKKQIAANPYIPNAAKKDIEKDLDKSKTGNKNVMIRDTNDVDERGPNKWFHPITKDSTYTVYCTKQAKLPKDEQDGFFVNIWNKKTLDYKEQYGLRAREAFMEEIQHNTPKMMFLLLPIFALILRIAFWSSKKYYVEHLIYSFHLHCFLFLFLAFIFILQMLLPTGWEIVNGWLIFFAVLYISWYIYRSLRVVYKRSRFRTITKIIGMSLMYLFAFTFCLCLLFFVSTVI
jgi:hypothetical protein